MKTEYKNSVATKRNITIAYLNLLNGNKKFSVTDVVKLANITRGTFYLHFENLTDLNNQILAQICNNFKEFENDFRMTDISLNPEMMFEKLNGILLKDIEYYRLIVKCEAQINFMDKIKFFILKGISNNFEIMKYVTELDLFKLSVQFIVGGIIDCYVEWFKGNLHCTLDALGAFLSRLIKNGLKGVIHYGNYNF